MKKTTRALYALLICSLVLFAATPTMANTSPSVTAKATLEKTVEQILDLLRSPAYADPATRQEQRNKIEAKVHTIFDFNEFSSRTVGPRWRTFSAEQKEQFTAAFANLLRATYLDKIDSYNGEKIKYTKELRNAKGNKVEIQTELTLTNDTVVPVFYRMLYAHNHWAVYDVIIEGISMVKNYRSQFADLLNRGTVEDLIVQITKKAEEIRKKTSK